MTASAILKGWKRCFLGYKGFYKSPVFLETVFGKQSPTLAHLWPDSWSETAGKGAVGALLRAEGVTGCPSRSLGGGVQEAEGMGAASQPVSRCL